MAQSFDKKVLLPITFILENSCLNHWILKLEILLLF